MKISILAMGSRGDLQPILALALGLRAVGHEVRIATHAEFEFDVRNLGLGFYLISIDPKQLMASDAAKSAMDQGTLSAYLPFAKLLSNAILQAGTDCLAACRGADMVIYAVVSGYVATSIAEMLNVPAIGAFLQPVHPTCVFPSHVAFARGNQGSILNQVSYFASDTVYWVPFRSAVNQFRKERLHLPPIPPWVNGLRQWQRRSPVIYGFSPQVVPKPRDWGDHIEITGYWFLDRPASWRPPVDLTEFLAAGPPPVYVGFGSMKTHRPRETAELALQALSQTRQRGLLATGWGGLSAIDLPDHIFSIEAVPHDWLFPQMAAVVHHGGAGTTAAGLRAGVPSIVVPHFGDQPFWGQRVAKLGVGPQPIPRKQLSVERLADAIKGAVTNKRMRKQAENLGKSIRAEDGIARAVEAIERKGALVHL